MTTIAIDLDVFEFTALEPAGVIIRTLRDMPQAYDMTTRQTEVLFGLADAIEAGADKRVIVLDVDGVLAEDDKVATRLRSAAVFAAERDCPTLAHVGRAVADALDNLTPPRPPEPTGLGAVVRDKHGVILVRSGGRWHDGSSLFDWDALPAPIEVLSPGVEGQRLLHAAEADNGTVTGCDCGVGRNHRVPS